MIDDFFKQNAINSVKDVPFGNPEIDAGGHPDFLQPPKKEEQNQETVSETKQEETVVAEEKATNDIKKDSSLNTDEKVQANNNETTKVPTFDDLLMEKTGSKYKNWEEVESIINKANEPYKFADERVSKANEWMKNGGSWDDYVNVVTTDFEKMDSDELIGFKLMLDNPGMTPEEAELEMKLTYGLDKWKEKAEDYDDGVEPETIQLQRLKFKRESQKALNELKNWQSQWRISPESVAQKEAEKSRAIQEKQKTWDSETETVVNKLSKFPIKISDTEQYDYIMTDSEKKDVVDTIKELFSNSTALYKSAIDQNHKMGVNMDSLVQTILKAKTYDRAVKFIAEQMRAKGAEKVVTDIKNTNFKPNEQKVVSSENKSPVKHAQDFFVKNL